MSATALLLLCWVVTRWTGAYHRTKVWVRLRGPELDAVARHFGMVRRRNEDESEFGARLVLRASAPPDPAIVERWRTIRSLGGPTPLDADFQYDAYIRPDLISVLFAVLTAALGAAALTSAALELLGALYL